MYVKPLLSTVMLGYPFIFMFLFKLTPKLNMIFISGFRLASIDFFRAIMSNDEKAISVSTKSFIRRLIAGIVIFLVPTIVYALLDVLSSSIGDTEFNEYITCTKCVFDPSGCDTEGLPELKQSYNVEIDNNETNNNKNKNESTSGNGGGGGGSW